MRYLVGMILAVLSGCAVKNGPELDPVKVQKAIYQLSGHVQVIEKKLGIVYPTPTPEAKK